MYNYPMSNTMFPTFPMGGRAPFQPTLAPPLYIGNLDDTVHEEQLFAHFSRYGPLHSLKIVKDRTTNRSRGFGYINFISAKDAENARMLSQYDKIGKSPIRLMYKRNVHETEGNNIYVKNIDPTVGPKELHSLFTRVGKVITVKVAQNPKGESLGYGYVLMENKEEAEKAITELNGTKLKEKEIVCSEFKPKDKRDISTNNNLYVKGLPSGQSSEEIHKSIETKFAEFGSILSLAARQTKDGKWFAFVCYKDPESAEKAIAGLNNKEVFGTEPLYVARHQSRHERDFELKKNYTTVRNENNLYIKNLKPEVTKEQLTQAFSEFGEVGSVAVISKSIKPDDVRGSGFVAFKVPQDATKAQADGPKSDEIKKLFLDGQEVYINFWQSKHQRDQFKASKSRRPFDHNRMQQFPRLPQGGNPFGGQMQPGMMNFPGFPPMMNPAAMMRMQPYGNQRPQNFQNRYPPRRDGYQGNRGYNQGGDRGGFQGGDRGGYQGGDRGGYQVGGGYQGNRQQQRPGGPQNYGGQQRKPYQNNRPGQDQRNQHGQQQGNQQAKETKPQDVALEANLTVQSLKDKLDDFLKLEGEKQRNILGELLYPKILKQSRPEHAPKITGMLVDFEVLTVQDILEMLEDDQILNERIAEAQELIISEGQN